MPERSRRHYLKLKLLIILLTMPTLREDVLRNLKDEERFDGRTVFRDGPRVAPRPDIPLKKNKLGRSSRFLNYLVVD